MTDREMLDAIQHVMNVQVANNEDDEGDRNLADRAYALEAIDAILNGVNCGSVRQFMTAEV
jgi:hypothetical protein